MTKQKVIILTIAGILILGGLTFYTKASSPSQKVEVLKKEMVKNQENSGYNECIRQVKEQEDALNKCIVDKVVAKGYSDGLDCVQEYTNPNCKDTTRYNAQVNATNECNVVEPSASPRLSQFDCINLLQK